MVELDEFLDEYDRALKSTVWPAQLCDFPSTTTSNLIGSVKRGPVKSLSSRCAALVAQHFDKLQGNEIEYLQIAEREKVAVELAKLRRCDAAAALKLAVEGSQCLVLPECSEVDEDTLMKAMEQASGVMALRELEPEEDIDHATAGAKGSAASKAKKGKSSDKKGTQATSSSSAAAAATSSSSTSLLAEREVESALRVLKLRNCGRGMSDRSAAACINLTRGALELLQLTGCFRLNDTALCQLLDASRTTLLSLDLSCNSRLGPQALQCIRSLPNLQELVLDNCTHMCDEDLLHLVGGAAAGVDANVPTSSSVRHTPPPLLALSLAGLTELTDASVVPLIRAVGGSLQSLNLSGCVHLTDRTIQAIRRYCGHLHSLGLGQLSEVSAEAMVGLFIAHPAVAAVREDLNVVASAATAAGAGMGGGMGGGGVRTSRMDTSSSSASSSSSSNSEDHFTGLMSAVEDDEDGGYDAFPHIGHLEEVLLQGCVSVTDDVIIHLVENNKRTLRALDINGCYQLTSRAATALRLHCHRSLHSLDLSFVRGILQESLGALVDACVGYELSKVVVWGCTQLGDKFFQGHRNTSLEIVGRMTA